MKLRKECKFTEKNKYLGKGEYSSNLNKTPLLYIQRHTEYKIGKPNIHNQKCSLIASFRYCLGEANTSTPMISKVTAQKNMASIMVFRSLSILKFLLKKLATNNSKEDVFCQNKGVVFGEQRNYLKSNNLQKLNATLGAVLILPFLIYSEVANAKDLGKRARSFEITEQGFVAMMEERLKKVDMKEAQKKMIEIGKKRVLAPEPVKGIARATKNREFYHDPTYILPEDAKLPCGKILYRAGTAVNPLDEMKLERRIFFVDGRDEEQLSWLLGNLREEQETSGAIQDRVILVAGSPVKLSERLKREIYYDQHGGILTKKWGIKAVPAIVKQDGNKLKINEIRI
ncbi:MAG: hypothetical protein HRU35_04575 [Rickettsiaceae bacterium]|nr:hypothetical protein [Rickettsiaceae bacterium]